MECLPTVVVRHRRENLKKCSLRGLEKRPDFTFYTYPKHTVPELPEYVVLSFDGEMLSENDQGKGIIIIDGTWKLAGDIFRNTPVLQRVVKRSLPPHFKTAYPRRQEDCNEPERGLASLEAIYIAHTILQRDTEGLLDHYHWKEEFLKMNGFKNSLY